MTDEYNTMLIGNKYGIDLTNMEQKQYLLNTFLEMSSADLVTFANDYGVSVSEMTSDMETLSDIINQTSDTFSDLADSLDSYKTSLAISDKSYLDPELKTQIAKQNFDKLLEQSMSSDTEVAQQAMQDLPGAADTYLSLAQKTETSILGYNASMSYVLSSLQNTEDYAKTYTKTTDDSQSELENQTQILKDSVDAIDNVNDKMKDILTSEDFNNYINLFNSFTGKDDSLTTVRTAIDNVRIAIENIVFPEPIPEPTPVPEPTPAPEPNPVPDYSLGQELVNQWGTDSATVANAMSFAESARPQDWLSTAMAIGTSVEALKQAAHIYGIPGYASGGYHPGGLAFVGEEGVELMNAPPSTFTSHSDTKTILAESNIDVVKELQNLRKDNKITKEELMAANIQLIKLTNKINNRESKWDNEGLPAERAV